MDQNHPRPQLGLGQTLPHLGPPSQSQGVPNPSDPVHRFPGPPKTANILTPPMQGTHNFQNTSLNSSIGPTGNANQGQPPRFGTGPPGPPLPGGTSVNGFMPPVSQGLMPQRPASMNRPWGPPPSTPSVYPQPRGNYHRPVSSQFVPPSSYHNSAPSAGGPVVNGTSNASVLKGVQQPPHQMTSHGLVSGLSKPPVSSSHSYSNSNPALQTSTPHVAFQHSSASVTSASIVSGASSLNSAPIKPPSQKSSRGASPVNEQSYDALEGHFSSNQEREQSGTVLQPSVGSMVPPPGLQMPPPPRQGIPGPPRPGLPPPQPQVGSLSASGHPQTAGQHPHPGYSKMYPGTVPTSSGGFNQPGGPVQPPGPSQKDLPSPQLGPSGGIPGINSGPPCGIPRGPTPGPPSGPLTGPHSVPSSSGPPTSVQYAGLGSSYHQPPPVFQGMVRPPSGPPPQLPGPPSGPLEPPSGPVGPPFRTAGLPSGPPGPLSGYMGFHSQPHLYQGYSQPTVGQGTGNIAGDFNRLGVNEMQHFVNLMQEKKLIPPDGVEIVRPKIFNDQRNVNCHPDVFRCTLNAIPQSSSLLKKVRLPLGILIHPFKDLSQLPVIQSSVIVRCRPCRTYINPFVTFLDQRRWKCNLCFKVNELPDEFSFDPVSKTYGDPQRRPEIKSATIEFIAPTEYMLRPPQPAVYLFVLDVSFNAVETGYLRVFTQTLAEELNRLPGDARTQIGFLCFDSCLYFFNLSEGLSQPQMMVVPDLKDIFLPMPDNLLINLHECREMVVEFLAQLPGLFEDNHETGNALGTALQAAIKLMSSTGGRITVMQTMLPTVGAGALSNREATSKASSLNASNLGPASSFYTDLALDCSEKQISVDLFMLNGQYADIASVSCISKHTAGSVQYYPSFHTARNPAMSDKFESDLRRYLTRKIGFESVMRVRCTRGVSIHTFHGNFLLRSTDLLSLPNVNPDTGFGMQLSIEDNLTESSNICFQAALLYTSSKGERRIRVHTLCVPVTNQLTEVFAGADQQAIAALLAKMAADRTVSSSLEDARDAMINACQDMLSAFAAQVPASQRSGALVMGSNLRLVPLFTLSMLKSPALKLTPNIKLDDRVFAQIVAKTAPTGFLLQTYYPHLYSVHALNDNDVVEHNNENIPKAPRLQLCSANIDRHGVYVMDQGECIYMMVGSTVSDTFCRDVFDVPNFISIPEGMVDLPELENPTSERLRNFISHLVDTKPGGVIFLVIREDSKQRHKFFQYMVEDRTESSMSYYEFLQFMQQRVKV